MSFADAELFFKLYRGLMSFVNEHLKILPQRGIDFATFLQVTPESRYKVHEAFVKAPQTIDLFLQKNPHQFSNEEMEIVSSWRHMVPGHFYVMKDYEKHALFLSVNGEVRVYGVLALTDPIGWVLQGRSLPVLTKTILLPFRDVIIYDGLLYSSHITFGGNIRKTLHEDLRLSIKSHGIITSLPDVKNGDGVKVEIQDKDTPEKKIPTLSIRTVLGMWHIKSMSAWDEDYFNEETQAYIQFSNRGQGSFQFGYVSGTIDYCINGKGRGGRAEFSWEGGDRADGTPLTGRGWAVLERDQLKGEIRIHQGDSSGFVAVRAKRTGK
ncbi:MAG: hypothetical protein SFY92_09290 [Verrucomicrobiae bacterium]|nr:hypothetical protein [Verrucomicrobiae bacterium]